MSYLLDTNIIIHFLKGNTEIREKSIRFCWKAKKFSLTQ
jgi:predicted nucleic acid-binding protein